MTESSYIEVVVCVVQLEAPVQLVDETDVGVYLAVDEALPIETRAEWTRKLAQELSRLGFSCSRSRTRVYVCRPEDREEPSGPPDFVCCRRDEP